MVVKDFPSIKHVKLLNRLVVCDSIPHRNILFYAQLLFYTKYQSSLLQLKEVFYSRSIAIYSYALLLGLFIAAVGNKSG